tara:strand:- start:150 stop:704 length:555 start_codon:yes stop_codon:yes gene_type:complete
MNKSNFIGIITTLIFSLVILTSCENRGDARKSPPDPALRVKKNIEEGRGFRLMDLNKSKRGGDFEFASSNELWKASLDTIDFMPLASANYSGGIIITDWYSEGNAQNESIKISIRFLTNEIRSDALDIKIFYKKCSQNINCKISEKSGNLAAEIKKKILAKAALYAKQKKAKNFKAYSGKVSED